MHSSFIFFFSSRRGHTRYWRDWSSDVCSSDLSVASPPLAASTSLNAIAAPASSAVPAVAAGSRLKVQAHGHETSHSESEKPGPPAGRPCLKHPGHVAEQECLVCHKPICRK